ncbi:hypothetical protein [Ascidiimonas sp. W6]|uniref:glucosamine inositolphosphorylceramide transferase family protein n=1 Tax=Ascidiimonas meishanensis TaxID=3128903 RepID=UPI0030EE1023
MKKRLRIAIVSENSLLTAWQHAIVSELNKSFLLETALKIEVKRPANMASSEEHIESWFWKLYKKLDKKIFQPKPDATKLIDGNDLFSETMTCQFCKEEDVKRMMAKELDVIINLTSLRLPEPLLSLSKYGIWYFIHADVNHPFYKPIGAWELFHKKPEIGAALCCQKSDHATPLILAKTFACTDRLSYSRNVNAILWQTFPLVITALRNLYLTGEATFFKKAIEKYPEVPEYLNESAEKYPKNQLILKHLWNSGFSKIKQLILSRFYFNQWTLLFHASENGVPELDLTKYKRIVPPKDRFWADPFLYKKNGKYYLFIEELIYKRKLGELAVMEIDEQGNYTQPKTILSKDYHLSYPFIFEEDGVLFMIPETSNNRDIQLYVCTDFPLKWELVETLMTNVVAVDTTIYKKDGLYWMLTNIKQYKGGSKHSELFLFSAEEITSTQWKPHPLNPIVSDVKQSRPAGSLFKLGEKLVRPAQNCSYYYGYGTNFCEITSMDEVHYKQEIIHTVNPKWKKDILATHTFNHLDKITISDALIKRKR